MNEIKITNVLQLFIKPRLFYVRIMKNKLEVKDLKSGKTISKTATTPFSNDRLLIAYYEHAETLLREIFNELYAGKIVTFSHHVLLQPVDDVIKEITPVEERIYVDFGAMTGGRVVKVYPTQEVLSDFRVEEIMNEYKKTPL